MNEESPQEGLVQDEGMAHAMASAEAPLRENQKNMLKTLSNVLSGEEFKTAAEGMNLGITPQMEEASNKAAEVYKRAEKLVPGMIGRAIKYGRAEMRIEGDEDFRKALTDAFLKRILEWNPTEKKFDWKDRNFIDGVDDTTGKYFIAYIKKT